MKDESANLIQDWITTNKQLKVLKKKEADLRKAILKDQFDYTNDDRTGTVNVNLGNDYKLKAVFKLTKKLNNKDNAVTKVLQEIEGLSPEGMFIIDRLVKWEPKLSATEYDTLPVAIKAVFDKVVTSKPAAPTLAFIEPKEDK